MKLLVFAHVGEAQSFLSRLQLRPTQDGVLATRLYRGKNFDLLLTGEGPLEALSWTSIAATQTKYQEIINLGLCAGLREDINVSDIYEIRSVYAHTGHTPLFQSFTCPRPQSSKDIITSFERVLTPEAAKELSVFSTLVDREAYGVAKAAETQGTPWRMIKLVSDLPVQQESAKTNLCEHIKEMAPELSEKLYQYFSETNESDFDNERATESKLAQTPEQQLYSDLIKHPELHFTFSMSKRLKKQLRSLQLKCQHQQIQDPLKNLVARELSQLGQSDRKLRPKDRAVQLLEALRTHLSPFKSSLDQELKQFIAPLERQSIQVRLDKDYEKEGLGLNTWIASEEDKQNFIQSISAIDLKKLTSIQRGEESFRD